MFKLNINRMWVNIVFLMIPYGLISCQRLVTVPPPNLSVTTASVYNADVTAISVFNGLYAKFSSSLFSQAGGLPSLSLYGGLSADEFTLWSGVTNNVMIAYYSNTLLTNDIVNIGTEYWNAGYANIFICNSALEALSKSDALTPSVKLQLQGEAKFIRAFNYFYLVNLYGDLPLALTSDYKINSLLPRVPKQQVYLQIISDLKEAQQLLNEGYVQNDGQTLYPINSAERVRPNKYAATALLARVYLYVGDYVNAETMATIVINKSNYYYLAALNGVFLKNSSESIWQLQPVTTGVITNTQDGYYFIVPSQGPNNMNQGNPVYLSNSLLNSFEPGDKRKTAGNWVNSVTVGSITYYFPYKYKINASATVSEYIMILRLGEQYLIRAEARAQLGNLGAAVSDLDSIRVRAGLSTTSANTKGALVNAIMHERQVELFTELGHRWFDLKRTGTVDSVMTTITPLKGGIWNINKMLFPIPLSDLKKDFNLSQNLGY